jgi:hypothetical protein
MSHLLGFYEPAEAERVLGGGQVEEVCAPFLVRAGMVVRTLRAGCGLGQPGLFD